MARTGFLQTANKKFRIRLELTEPNKKEDVWELTAIATVMDVDGPVPDVEVQFYHNGSAVDSPVATEGEGRASRGFDNLTKGNHTFEAQVVGTAIKSRSTKNLKDDKPKKPGKIICHESGSSGKYVLMFQVLTEDDSPVKGAIIRILDVDCPRGFFDLEKTNDQGVATRKINLRSSARKDLTITVLGSPISTRKSLY